MSDDNERWRIKRHGTFTTATDAEDEDFSVTAYDDGTVEVVGTVDHYPNDGAVELVPVNLYVPADVLRKLLGDGNVADTPAPDGKVGSSSNSHIDRVTIRYAVGAPVVPPPETADFMAVPVQMCSEPG